jgi:hypothetical protein
MEPSGVDHLFINVPDGSIVDAKFRNSLKRSPSSHKPSAISEYNIPGILPQTNPNKVSNTSISSPTKSTVNPPNPNSTLNTSNSNIAKVPEIFNKPKIDISTMSPGNFLEISPPPPTPTTSEPNTLMLVNPPPSMFNTAVEKEREEINTTSEIEEKKSTEEENNSEEEEGGEEEEEEEDSSEISDSNEDGRQQMSPGERIDFERQRAKGSERKLRRLLVSVGKKKKNFFII